VRAHRGIPVAVAVVLALAGCSGSAPPAPSHDTVRFASYDFSENQILVEVYADAARRAGVPVTVESGVATREVTEPALEQGVVDVVVDYLGTASRFVGRSPSGATETPEQLRAGLTTVLAGRGVTVLEPAKAEDQNGFAVATAFAAAHGVGKLSELAPLASGLVFGGPPECADRPLCLPGLRDVYGLTFGKVRAMPSRAATVEALSAGEIDVGLLETTDARVGNAPVLLLLDDRSLQPHENVVPLVRTAALKRWGQTLRTALDQVSSRLTTAGLVQLNRSVEVDGLTPAQAAARWWDAE
jgi:osmoprotectant transport system substrate-binding protein